MLYLLECPYHTQTVKNAIVNWTATYRHDSDIVAPYERWQYHDPSVTQVPQTFNYAANKTKKVRFFKNIMRFIGCKMHASNWSSPLSLNDWVFWQITKQFYRST